MLIDVSVPVHGILPDQSIVNAYPNVFKDGVENQIFDQKKFDFIPTHLSIVIRHALQLDGYAKIFQPEHLCGMTSDEETHLLTTTGTVFGK